MSTRPGCIRPRRRSGARGRIAPAIRPGGARAPHPPSGHEFMPIHKTSGGSPRSGGGAGALHPRAPVRDLSDRHCGSELRPWARATSPGRARPCPWAGASSPSREAYPKRVPHHKVQTTTVAGAHPGAAATLPTRLRRLAEVSVEYFGQEKAMGAKRSTVSRIGLPAPALSQLRRPACALVRRFQSGRACLGGERAWSCRGTPWA